MPKQNNSTRTSEDAVSKSDSLSGLSLADSDTPAVVNSQKQAAPPAEGETLQSTVHPARRIEPIMPNAGVEQTALEKEYGLPPVVTFESAREIAGEEKGEEFYHALALSAYGDFRGAGPKPPLAIRGLLNAAHEPDNQLAKESLGKVLGVFKQFEIIN